MVEVTPPTHLCTTGDACTLLRVDGQRAIVRWADGVESTHKLWVFDQFFVPLPARSST